ncbi:MAG: transposase family protein [Proteobacteria bacterium]|nr:transposase family protein [Pseudomonadota bacterium]
MHRSVREVCDAVWEVLQPKVMAPPTENEWRRIENEFSKIWNFPNCIGALDGKHVVIQSPAKSGSLFFNYKTTFSINLMALVDANYRFTFVDIGQYGSNADGPVFQKSEFGKMYLRNQLNIPGPKYLPRARYLGTMPHVLVAFPLCPTIMRPFPKGRNATRMPRPRQVFNYRLSRARRIVENAFGILAQRFRIYNRRMQYSVNTVVKIVKATCVLHNFLRDKNMNVPNIYARLNPDRLDYLGENGTVLDLANLPGYRSTNEAQCIRRVFTHYFNSVAGRLQWQDARIVQRC